MALVQIIGGKFQDLEGNVLANGYLSFELSSDGQISTSKLIGSSKQIKITLDTNGDVFGTQVADNPKQFVWPNDQINPTGTFYTVTAYSSSGQLVWGPQNVQVLSSPSPFDVGTWVPYPLGPTVVPMLEVNSVANLNQALLNLINGTGVTITDQGTSVQISVLAPVQDIVCYVPGTLTASQNLLRYNVRRSLSFPVNFSGSIAKALVAATSSAVINVQKNGVTVGTITYGAGSSSGTLALAGGMSLASGDYLDFISVNADGTLAGINFTLVASRLT